MLYSRWCTHNGCAEHYSSHATNEGGAELCLNFPNILRARKSKGAGKVCEKESLRNDFAEFLSFDRCGRILSKASRD